MQSPSDMLANAITLSAAGKEMQVSRARLRQWLEMEELRDGLREAAERGETSAVSDLLCAYLSAASGEPAEFFASIPWFEAALAFAEISRLNEITKPFPIFDVALPNKKDKLEPWDYAGRKWYLWLHLLASAYGWGIEQIASLEIEDAVGLIQEIQLDDQFGREWEYSLSENAYEYIPAMKSSRFKPLPRPAWMNARKAETPKVTKLPAAILPMGEIINLSGMGLHGTLVH